jgi:hypothetical protein
MEKRQFKICICWYLLLATSSCTKSSSDDMTDQPCLAGSNGDLTIVASPTHHGAYAKALNAYIKFNAQDYPGNSPADYDLVVSGNLTDNKFYFRNMNCGNYYVYAEAIDTNTHDTLRGGIPIQPMLLSGEFDIILHVSE